MGMRPWQGRAALAFVLLTLAALVVVPVLVQRRVDVLRSEIEAAEPARTTVTQLRFDLLNGMFALSELLLTGNPEYAGTYAAAYASERATFEELAPLAARLGPEVVEGVAQVQALATEWHERIAVDEIVRRRAEGGGPLQAPRERYRFGEVLRATVALDSVIVRASAVNRAQIREAEQLGLALTFVLGLLALLAAGAVAALNARVRRLAAESERRRWEAEAALAESARANEARTRLLQGITHDVKNPLGAAKGYAELLSMGIKAPVRPEQAPLLEGLKRSVDGALAIITDLLDVARADSGALAVRRVEADLTAVAREAMEDHRAAAETAGHVLEFERSPEPLAVRTDPERVRQVLQNLLSNAVKYTPAPGRIEVRTEVRSGEETPGAGSWATVRVADTGPGIPQNQRELIFNEFSRLDESADLKGHGLGLAIARRIARLLDGDLTVADDTEIGAAFVLWLPYAAGTEGDPSSRRIRSDRSTPSTVSRSSPSSPPAHE